MPQVSPGQCLPRNNCTPRKRCLSNAPNKTLSSAALNRAALFVALRAARLMFCEGTRLLKQTTHSLIKAPRLAANKATRRFMSPTALVTTAVGRVRTVWRNRFMYWSTVSFFSLSKLAS